MELLPEIVKKKNEWLIGQVEVQYPTQESLKGRDLYSELAKSKRYSHLETVMPESSPSSSLVDELYLIDFHRLTVMFSVLQASQWAEEQERAYVLEFFSQIILSEEFRLYIGFIDTNPVACAIVTQQGEEILISDIVVDAEYAKSADISSTTSFNLPFVKQLVDFLNIDRANGTIWVEE
jgi:hypothetical protein